MYQLKKKFDYYIFFKSKQRYNKQAATMATTTRQNQISWQQFSLRERMQRQQGEDFVIESRVNARDDDEAKFDISVSTPRRGAQTKRESARVRFVFERQQPQQTTPPANNEKEHEEIKKPKTRAEKRAAEEEQIEAAAAAPKHKERRSDYWVQQDDLRMKRARGFKLSVDTSAD
jgi:hypothetical protein